MDCTWRHWPPSLMMCAHVQGHHWVRGLRSTYKHALSQYLSSNMAVDDLCAIHLLSSSLFVTAIMYKFLLSLKGTRLLHSIQPRFGYTELNGEKKRWKLHVEGSIEQISKSCEVCGSTISFEYQNRWLTTQHLGLSAPIVYTLIIFRTITAYWSKTLICQPPFLFRTNTIQKRFTHGAWQTSPDYTPTMQSLKSYYYLNIKVNL